MDLTESDIAARYQAKREKVVEQLAQLNRRRESLPDKFQLQETHMTVPASNPAMITKAFEAGSTKAPAILEKLGISLGQLATGLGVSEALISRVVDGNPVASLVMIDNEDGNAPREDVVRASRLNAIEGLKKYGSFQYQLPFRRPLCFFRPTGLELSWSIDDIIEVVTGVAEGSIDNYPLDGIILPKIDTVEQLALVSDLLGELEHKIGLKESTIALQFLVESPLSLKNLPELINFGGDRLCGIILGMADYSSELELPELDHRLPIHLYTRTVMVQNASPFGIPAVETMSFNYPVADPSLDAESNRARVLGRMKELYDNVTDCINLGMRGKWVGHPLQLFGAKIAFENFYSPEKVAAEQAKYERYREVVEGGSGAAIIGGDMSDRATHRQVEYYLTRARLRGSLPG